MKIPEREQDVLDFSSVTLSLLSDGAGKLIDDFSEVADNNKVLIECKSGCKKQTGDMDDDHSPNATTRGTPSAGPMPKKAINGIG